MNENVTKEGIEVMRDQVWRDLDARMNGRQCRVNSVSDGKAVMFALVDGLPIGRKTVVSVRRMHRGSTGWALVSQF